MSSLTLTKTRLSEGVWEGVISRQDASDSPPRVAVTHMQVPLEGVQLSPLDSGGAWSLRIPVPVQAISDGVQTIVIADQDSGDTIGAFSLIAGEVLSDDIRVEVSLLREELDLLKRAFRRHCLETT